MKNLFFVIFSIMFLACDGQKIASDKVSNPSEEKDLAVSKQSFKEDINVAEAKIILAGSKEVVLLDVRTPQEIALGKIENAVEIDYSAPDFKNKVGDLDKNKEYIVYCAAGGRSARAVKLMKELGFEKTHNLTPGYSGWSASK